ncbi:MAG: hypothetical protein COZ27_02235 [Candidatus Moranbacteria bacterium CG_4_10_14_3_um_filter_41_65]|nr:MAG: hypothetical protein AUK58_02510 [Candidatus Moranbacteria bacterium CG2_30_41_165]PIP25237.1 MAG: hypothetical protein COX32_04490 [Candidatus Moranbacteria bacterium CG23_combo_of_CG06-09_8_20_14_all_41_28]PIW94516.1 MAG: hypothetical protein COZ86_00560 [Candidatus Moranbacteria bacterium CG_4_8_14_3_um_filter_41_13]PIX91549.1 MAG: hypothetical protein COZ27_02235 [Candidatus Moranbacteria bacterium CG_4_10_14_3_um_filter_41_65]
MLQNDPPMVLQKQGRIANPLHSQVNLHTDITFFQNEIIQFLLSIALFLVLANFLLLGYFIRPTEDILVFHYNVYFGVDLQGAWWQLYLLPSAGLFFFLIHSLLAYFFYEKQERIATYILLFFSNILSLGLIIAVAGVVFINY